MLEYEDFEDFDVELDALMDEIKDAVVQVIATKRSNDTIVRQAGRQMFDKAMEHLHWFVEAKK